MKDKGDITEAILKTSIEDWDISHGIATHKNGTQIWLSQMYNGYYMRTLFPDIDFRWKQRRKLKKFFGGKDGSVHVKNLLR